MLFRQTHNRITKSLLPNLPLKTINEINRQKDHPSREDKLLNMILEGTFQYPNSIMNRRNHRKYNHSPMMSLLKGYQVAGLQGAEAMLTHDMTDMFSDFIVRNYGTMARNMFEIGYNYLYSQNKRRIRRNSY